MIDERNPSELGAEFAPRVENQMKVKHRMPYETSGLRHRLQLHSPIKKFIFFARRSKERSPIALAFTPLWK
jgi:hypothetical protein